MQAYVEKYLQYLDKLPSPWDQVVIGGVVFVVAFVLLRIFHFLVLARLKSLTSKSERRIMKVLHDLIACISVTSYIAIAAFAAIHIVQGEPGWLTAIFNAFIIITLSIDVAQAAEIIIGSAIRLSIRGAGKTPNQSMMNFVEFMIRIVVWAIALLMILSNLGVNITALVASLGIGGVAVALAVQQILGDIFNSVSLYIDQPFEVGDFIVVGEDKGTVEKIGLKSTRIRALTGEELIVSNSELTRVRIQNFRRLEDRRIQFDIGVEYGTPTSKLKKAKELVQKAIESTEKTTFQRVHFKKFGDSALIFEIVYTLHSNDYTVHMNVLEEINLKVAEEFEKENLVMAFPTMTVHMAKTS